MIGAMISLLLFLLIIIFTLFLNSIEFPLPITDTGTVRYSSIPVIILLLILINSIIFLFLQAPNYYQGGILADSDQSAQGMQLLYNYVVQIWTYGYRSVFVHEGVGIGAMAAFTSMFMHADMWHLIGNMIFLWTFGRRVEDACGSWRFLLFYLMAGVVANIGSDLLSRGDIPGIGASGAIAGVMGAYLILFPGTLIRCFWGAGIVLRVPIVIVLKLFMKSENIQKAPLFRWTIDLPAWTFLIVWLAMNTLPSLQQVVDQGRSTGGVNTLAHLTGFLGSLFIFLFVKKDMVTRYFAGRTI